MILGYADSTKVPMKEESYVKDSIEMYKWVRQRTSKKIYFWGLSLGGFVSIETTARLKKEGIVPSGLMIEASATQIIDALAEYSAAKVSTKKQLATITVTTFSIFLGCLDF